MIEGFIQLEIGDWVKPKKSAWPFKVSGITEQGVTKEGPYYYKYDEVEPIPLTPEILENNGWRIESDLWINNDVIALEEGCDGHKYWWHMFDSPIVSLDYVHELQHVLRLCGINRDIEL